MANSMLSTVAGGISERSRGRREWIQSEKQKYVYLNEKSRWKGRIVIKGSL